MQRENIEHLIELLGGYPSRGTQGWVQTPCLFARWNHSKGTDSKPSFGIKINEEGDSIFHCFTCNSTGDLQDLVMELRSLMGQGHFPDIKIREAMKFVMEAECDGEGIVLPDYETAMKAKKEPPRPFTEFPKFWLDSFPKMYDHPYLKKRGIDAATAARMDIRYDFSRKAVCFPFYDKQGRLAGLQARDITGNPEVLRYYFYAYKGGRNPDVFWGEDRIDWDRPVVLTEGPIDIAHILPVYDNVLGSFTTGLGARRMKRIREAQTIITLYDHGEGGNRGREAVDEYLGKTSKVIHLTPTEQEDDAGNMSPDQIRGYLEGIVEL